MRLAAVVPLLTVVGACAGALNRSPDQASPAPSTMELRLKLQPDPQTMARVAAALRTLGYQAESNAESVAVPSNEGGALVVVTRADGAMFVTLQGGSDDDPHRKELLFLARSLDAAAGPNPDAFLRRLRWALKAKWTPPSFLLDEDPRRERYGSNPRSVGLALRFDGNGQITDLDIDRTSGIASLDTHVKTAVQSLVALGPVPAKLLRRGQVLIDLRVELAELPSGDAMVAARGARGDALAGAEPLSPQRALRERERLMAALATQQTAIRACYDEERAFDPTVAGALIARLAIDENGRVTSAEASPNGSLKSEQLQDCVLSGLRSMVFFVAPDAQPMTLEYTMNFPEPAATRGALVEDAILRVFREARPRLKDCYERELADQPSLVGRATATLSVDSRGQVQATALKSSSLNEVNVEQCVLDVVQTLVFPKPQGGGVAVVEYPMNFDRSGVMDNARHQDRPRSRPVRKPQN